MTILKNVVTIKSRSKSQKMSSLIRSFLQQCNKGQRTD